MDYNPFTVTNFAERLTAILQQRHMSQSQLATALGVSRSTITGWLRYHKLPDAGLLGKLCDTLGCSADWLLGLRAQTERQNPSGSIQWIEEIPPYLSDTQRDQIAYGIRLFNLFVRENRSAQDIRTDTNGQSIRFALQAALRSGALRLTHVARNTALEDALKQRFPGLKEIIVADVPQHYDDTIIRTELVSFLAATTILSRVIRESAVGFGSGYTLLRLCEQSIPSLDQFSGTHWIPLLSFPPENTRDYSANMLARLMSIRHPGSSACYLPHPDECHAPNMLAVRDETQRLMKNMQTIFVSVSGVDRRDRSGKTHLLADFRSADYAAEAPDLRAAYADLPDKPRFGAELLRYLLDENGEIISRDSAVGSQIDLDILRYHCEMIGKVCIVAARDYKAKAVHTCLRSKLANALVIDSEIADALLTFSV